MNAPQILTVPLILFSLFANAENETLKYPADDLKVLKVHNSFGDVNIAPSSHNEAGIVASKRKWGERCHLNVDKSKGILTVEISDKGWIMDNECRVDLIISIPKDIKVELRAGSGDIEITGTRGDLDVKVGSGRVNIQADLKQLSALSGSGDIEFSGFAEVASVKTGSGDIDVKFKEPPKKTQLSLRSGVGDVTVSLPEGSTVKAATSTGNGSVRNEFIDVEEAGASISASSELGNIQIRER